MTAAATIGATRKLRVPLQEAADLLGMHPETLRKLAVEQGEFTVLRNSGGPKQGRRLFFLPTELEVFGRSQLEGLREFRGEQRRRSRRIPME
jgi:hypothetical protein